MLYIFSIVFLLIKLSRFSFYFCHLLDYSGYTSSNLIEPSWNSPSSFTSSIQGTDDENLSDTEYYQQKQNSLPLTNGHSHNSMTNGYVQYNKSERSRSCENSLDSCGRKSADELTISSSSLIDLPITHADYDNLASVNGNHDSNGHTPTTSPPSATLTKSPISSELDQKTKDAIDARLKDIDDEFELNCKNFVFLFIR